MNRSKLAFFLTALLMAMGSNARAAANSTAIASDDATSTVSPILPSPGDSHPIFDWSKHKGETEVQHPFAKKGLVEITKNKTYIYKVKPSPQHHSASVHLGMIDLRNLKNPDATDSNGATFADNYNSSTAPALFMDFHWDLWRTPLGKIGLTAGSGMIVAQGHGHFEHPDLNPGKTPKEMFTFIAFPNSVGLSYQLKMWDQQFLVPYGEAGLTGFTFTELRSDNKAPKFGVSAATYFAVGGAINLNYLSPSSMLEMDREYGINRVYLFAEFRTLVSLSQRYDFSSNLINGGLLFEF